MLSSDIQESVSATGHHIEASNQSYLSHRRRNQRIDLKDENAVCYLKQGRVSVYPKDNNLLIMSLDAPTVLRLTQMTDDNKHLYLRCDTNCTVWTIEIRVRCTV